MDKPPADPSPPIMSPRLHHLRPATNAHEPYPWLGSGLVATAAVLVYLNSLSNGFAFDDLIIIAENGLVHDLRNPLGLLLSPYWPGPDALDRGLYRPFTSLAFAVQWFLGDGSPLLFHSVNVGLHAGVTVLLHLLLRALVPWSGALAGALVFAVHPIHVEAVANGVGQAELWAGLSVLGAALVYVRRGSRPLSGARLMAICILYGAGMLFKEHVIVLPALLFGLDVAEGRVSKARDLQRWLPLAVLLAGIALNYLVLRWIVLGGSLSGRAAVELPFLADPRTRFLTALSIWPEYARLLFFPVELSAMYDPATVLPQESVSPSVIAGGLILGAGLLSLLLPRSWPGWGLGFYWFLVAVLPVSNLVLPVGTLLGERTLYLPSVAVGLWVGFGVARLPAGSTVEPCSSAGVSTLRRTVLGGLVLVMTLLSIRVVTRNPVWRDNPTLFSTTLRDHPESFRAHWFEALRLAEAGDTLDSAASWQRARSIYDANSTFLTQYSAFQRSRGETAEAVRLADEALRLRPGSPTALFYRGLLEADLGRPEEGVKRAERLEELGYSGLARQLHDSLGVGAPPGP